MHPVVYPAMNVSSVLDGSGNPDSSVSPMVDPHAVAAVINSVDGPAMPVPKGPDDIIAPLSIPHLFWRASASILSAIPAHFNYLLDNGSHLILIHNSLVDELSLHHCKLHEPIETELVMHEGEHKVVVKLYDYVKLHLCDSSSEYITKSVCTVMAPNLVAPIILGLPF